VHVFLLFEKRDIKSRPAHSILSHTGFSGMVKPLYGTGLRNRIPKNEEHTGSFIRDAPCCGALPPD
ncbi:MAG: hypothetical protein SVU32_06670, partial [Candidatus Nanohaloarchaea archaeon]|nr:hypothetical protein [Candidatus Nanohaloarchaea archaeon]